MSINKAIVVGRLGGDPELKYTQTGQGVCKFSVATPEQWTDKQGQKHERVEWHRVVVWGKLGELCSQYLAKGRQVYIEGKLQTHTWDDDKGVKHYTTEILGQNIQFLGEAPKQGDNPTQSKQAQKPSGSPAPTKDTTPPDMSFAADDIPF